MAAMSVRPANPNAGAARFTTYVNTGQNHHHRWLKFTDMFEPGKDDVRRFFCAAWQKSQRREPLTPLEAMAAQWIDVHPEYHALLSDTEKAIAQEFSVEKGQMNPFLHLSMHLSIEEQVSINQPIGIAEALGALTHKLGDRHEAMHVIMDCLGEALWMAQRNHAPISEEAYLEAILRKARA